MMRKDSTQVLKPLKPSDNIKKSETHKCVCVVGERSALCVQQISFVSGAFRQSRPEGGRLMTESSPSGPRIHVEKKMIILQFETAEQMIPGSRDIRLVSSRPSHHALQHVR